MKNSPFSDIKKKKKKIDADSFIEEAKVDGSKLELDKNERRGTSYVDKRTGEKIKLSGKILQVPVNGYELNIINEGARKKGLSLSSYLRTLGLEFSEKNQKTF